MTNQKGLYSKLSLIAKNIIKSGLIRRLFLKALSAIKENMGPKI